MILRIAGLSAAILYGTVTSSQPTATSTTSTQTASTQTATTTTQAAPQPEKPKPMLTTLQIVSIVGGLIAIALAIWKLPRWIIFSTLETSAGRKALVELVHEQLELDAGRKALAGYVLGHFEREPGRTEFRKFVLSILTADEAEEPLRNLVTRLIVFRESKEKVDGHLEALRTQLVEQRVAKPTTQEVQLKTVEIENSTIAQLSADPGTNQEEMQALVRKIAIRLGIDDASKGEPPADATVGRKTPEERLS